MLVISIELWPYGQKKYKRRLGTAKIANTGKNPDGHVYGDYEIVLQNEDKIWKNGKVYNFPRLDYNAWDLLFIALGSSLGARRVKRLLKEMEQKW